MKRNKNKINSHNHSNIWQDTWKQEVSLEINNFRMTKMSTDQKLTTVLNLYVPNNLTSKYKSKGWKKNREK